MRNRIVLAAAACALVLAGCSSDPEEPAAPTTTPPATTASPSPTQTPSTIVDVAAGNPDFSTLVSAVQAAGLAATLSGPGPFTVFAPTNEAFAELGDVVDKLLEPDNKDALTSILTYHAVSGEVTSSEIEPGEVKTVEGSTVELSTEGGVMVNDAEVVQADVDASNGVIHVIDKVLVPPTVDVSEL